MKILPDGCWRRRFVRYQPTVTAPLPEADKAARAVGQECFQKFVELVGRQTAGRNRLFPRGEEGEQS